MRIIGEPKKKRAVLVALPSMVLLVCLYFLGRSAPSITLRQRQTGNKLGEGFPHQEAPPKRNLIIGSRLCGADHAPTFGRSWLPSSCRTQKRWSCLVSQPGYFETDPRGSREVRYLRYTGIIPP